MIGVCDLLLQLLSKAAIDHMNLAEGDTPCHPCYYVL